MKKYLFTGFITLLPIALTIIVIVWLFNLFTSPLAGITEKIILNYEKTSGLSLEKHAELVMFTSRIIALIALFILILILGFFGQKFLLKFFLKVMDRLFSRIPIVRTIYRLSHDITKAVFTDPKKMFKETVLVPFPHSDTVAIGFVTGETPRAFHQEGVPHTDLAVFVPTAPHPMSGFVVLTPKTLVRSVDVSIEDAFKFLISCGVIHPGEPIPSPAKENK